MPAGRERTAKLLGVIADEVVADNDRDLHCRSLPPGFPPAPSTGSTRHTSGETPPGAPSSSPDHRFA
jgi:hypothetical protein